MGKKGGGNSKSGAKGAKQGGGADDDDVLLEALEAAGAERGRAQKLSQLGDCLLATGEFLAAAGRFSEAAALDPNNGLPLARRSQALLALGRTVEGLADARAAVALGGPTPAESAECCCHLGAALVRSGPLPAARDAFDRGLTHEKGHKGCLQGKREVLTLLVRLGGDRAKLERAKGDVEVQTLRTMPVPEDGVLGKGFEVVHLTVGRLTLKFLLNTTLTLEATITPETCSRLLQEPMRRTIDLENVAFEGGAAIGTIKDCPVASFMQAGIAEQALGVTVHGMLGLPFLERYDFLLDRVREEQRFKEAGAAAEGQETGLGVLRQPGILLPSQLLGLPVQVSVSRSEKKEDRPPPAILGVIDTGSMFSILNWKAAQELGLADGPEDPRLAAATKVAGATATGTAEMPLVNVKIRFCSTPADGNLGWKSTGALGSGWHLALAGDDEANNAAVSRGGDFGRVNAAIGNAMQFELLRDSTVGEFGGAAILLGQDVLCQATRLSLSVKDRQISYDPPGRLVDAAPF
ncbi:unnamed protein product [Polarella glacialis]|uniref:Uncharacterized protein n=1 Tax=Polarella glacialis TaxID=89957 RepID=A0A813ERL6_POLGL|nr:unnamed protein product [Polarella glacialis]CAE8652942.1 unnamed protein product [Polarella glacialis]